MRSSEVINIPRPSLEYNELNQKVIIRTVEQALQDLRNDMVSHRDASDNASSLARRRHQFLLMGA